MLQADLLFADRYRLIKRIGQGGFAEVWLADDTLADLQVAIKIYGGMDEDGLKIFVKEINKVYHLNHTNLLKPQYVAAWNNMPYLVMTYCSAGSLEKQIGQITEQEIWKILHDVASGLAYLHSNNIIHQDIKPANILQDDMGNYVIIDFGISTLARDTLRKSTLRGNTSAGTLAYMAPERFSKDPTPLFASDIWSLGAMLFELLEGKTPFPADFGGGMQKAGAELIDITANVSQELKSLIYKMLSLNTWDRPTATTLVEWAKNPSAIEKPSLPIQRKITKPAEQPQQPNQPPRKRWIWIMVALLIIAGLGMIGIRKYQDYQLEIAIKEQIRQDSIRQVQIQDSIREVRRQDSIRAEQERIRRNDSIAAVQAAEQERKRLERKQNQLEFAGTGSHYGYDYVDLGLSVKWATCNVGASRPEDYGFYFSWAETAPKSVYSWSNYKWCNGNINAITKYCTISSYGTACYGNIDNNMDVDLSDDAANVNMNGNWRMPTRSELEELHINCAWNWTTLNGLKGYKVTSKINGKSIFIPAAGCRVEGSHKDKGSRGTYWSNSLTDEYPFQAYKLSFDSRYVMVVVSSRAAGCSIRPVCP